MPILQDAACSTNVDISLMQQTKGKLYVLPVTWHDHVSSEFGVRILLLNEDLKKQG